MTCFFNKWVIGSIFVIKYWMKGIESGFYFEKGTNKLKQFLTNSSFWSFNSREKKSVDSDKKKIGQYRSTEIIF